MGAERGGWDGDRQNSRREYLQPQPHGCELAFPVRRTAAKTAVPNPRKLLLTPEQDGATRDGRL